MSSCGREDDDVEQSLAQMAAPKPGSCCSKKVATAQSTSSSTTNDGGDDKPNSCCQSKDGKGTCSSASSSSAAASSSSCSSSSSSSLSLSPPVTGIVPPPRVIEKSVVGRKIECMKCRSALSQVNLRDAISCAECFTFLFMAKVKSALRLKCSIPKGARVLVGLSGGASSSALARVLFTACDQTLPKRLFFGFDMIHIDETCLAIESEEEAQAYQRAVEASYTYLTHPPELGRRLLIVPIEEILNLCTDEEWKPMQSTNSATPSASTPASSSASASTSASAVSSSSSSSSTSTAPSSSSSSSSSSALDLADHGIVRIPTANASANRTRLRSIFASLRDSSDKLDLLQHMRRRLLTHMTRTCGYVDLLLGTSSSTTAEDLFANIAKGRGALLPLIGTQKEWRWETNILYPMREQPMAQIVLFNHYMKVDTNFRYSWMNSHKRTAATGHAGINKATHDFLSMLDAKFSSTVLNILGSVSKMIPPAEASHTDKITSKSHCSLCAEVIVAAESEEDLKTRHAGVGKREVTPVTAATLQGLTLCYACTALLQELNDAAQLPIYILRGIHNDHRTAPPAQVEAGNDSSDSNSSSNSSSSSSTDVNNVTIVSPVATVSTYPPGWYDKFRSVVTKDHAERVEENRRRKEAQREQEERERQIEMENVSASPDGMDDNNNANQHLYKQSREDMKSSFAEFLLTED